MLIVVSLLIAYITKMHGKNILICPLDWGIGHSTRCIPIIRRLLNAGANVIIAADKRPYALLKKEFPDLEFIRLPGYDVTYPTDSRMALKMVLQSPRIIMVISREHRALRRLVKRHRIDLVISDGRFGLWSKLIPCIYMTHQTMVKFPVWMKPLEPIFHRLHRWLIKQYTECWIPDYAGEKNITGDLSHKYPLPQNALYTGPLTRFFRYDSTETTRELLVILSGPEPQRTIFERLVVDQLQNIPSLKALILQGKTEVDNDIKISDNARIVSHLSSSEINEAFLSSDIILSRPGHSTVMDLAILGKKAILVPTPGQTEQEYLAGKFMREKVYYSEAQDGFDLRRALKRVKEYTGLDMVTDSEEIVVERVKNLLS